MERKDKNIPTRIGSVGRVVLFMVCCAFTLAFAAPWIPNHPGMRSEFYLGTITSFAALLLSALFVRWDGLFLRDIGVAIHRGSLLRLLWGFLIGLFLVMLCATISAACGNVRWVRGPGIGLGMWTTALFAYLALSCREELGFHGYPLRRLEQTIGLSGAQLFVAFVFAVEHRLGGLPWPQAVFGAGVGSLLFGMAAIATRSLGVPIGMHAAWNFGQYTLGLKGQPGLLAVVVEPGREERAELVAMTIYVAVFGAATVGFGLWHLRRDAIDSSSA
jgi:membrane protease YdiL (CAAX protease family)